MFYYPIKNLWFNQVLLLNKSKKRETAVFDVPSKFLFLNCELAY